jgi:hypothetical protein
MSVSLKFAHLSKIPVVNHCFYHRVHDPGAINMGVLVDKVALGTGFL